MKRVAILQSNYIPWKGYFDLISSVDTFVLYDDMQYTRRDWRNRNKIKTPHGSQWLTIPVLVKGKYEQKINETQTANADWYAKHWQQLEQNYQKCQYFDQVAEWLYPLYHDKYESNLSRINRTFIESICNSIGVETEIRDSSEFILAEGKSERLASLCEQINASTYVSGPAAKDYMDESIFSEKGITVEWMDYSNYPEHPQLWGEFEHSVTILDLLFNVGVGSNVNNYMKYIK